MREIEHMMRSNAGGQSSSQRWWRAREAAGALGDFGAALALEGHVGPALEALLRHGVVSARGANQFSKPNTTRL